MNSTRRQALFQSTPAWLRSTLVLVMSLANSLYAFVRNLAHLIADIRETSYARVVAWNERSSKRAEQRLKRIGQAFHNLAHRDKKPGVRPSR